jgi:hypothetical protein
MSNAVLLVSDDRYRALDICTYVLLVSDDRYRVLDIYTYVLLIRNEKNVSINV